MKKGSEDEPMYELLTLRSTIKTGILDILNSGLCIKIMQLYFSRKDNVTNKIHLLRNERNIGFIS